MGKEGDRHLTLQLVGDGDGFLQIAGPFRSGRTEEKLVSWSPAAADCAAAEFGSWGTSSLRWVIWRGFVPSEFGLAGGGILDFLVAVN
jgi:hypothetical protein